MSIKKYIIGYFYRLKTKIDVDKDFYEEDFFLIDLESDKKCLI